MERVFQLLHMLGVSPDTVDLEEVDRFPHNQTERSLYEVFRLLREPFPATAIEYHDPSAKKKPFMSHEFYRKRILDVAPRHVEFEIHNSEFKTLIKNGVEHHVAVANCSLRIETWKFSALGTNVVKFLNNDPDTPVDLGASLKSAVSNAFVWMLQVILHVCGTAPRCKRGEDAWRYMREAGGQGRSAHA